MGDREDAQTGTVGCTGTLQYVIVRWIEKRSIEGCRITMAEPFRQVGFPPPPF